MTNVKNFLGLVAGLVMLGALGCGVGATESSGNTAGSSGDAGSGGAAGSSSSSGGSGGGAPVCPDVPWQSKQPVPEACGIWVSISLGDDANEGTQAAPVKSLTRAIELAAEGPGRVYACAEIWTDPIVVPGHVSLHGGFDCAAGWTFQGAGFNEFRATLRTGPDQIAVTWIDGGKGGAPLLTDFEVQAADAAKPGGSSLALLVRDDLPLTIEFCRIEAGDGANGLGGIPADMAGIPGLPGNVGADACSAAVSKGGAPPELACAAGVSKGGAGGDSSTMTAANGADGGPVSGPSGGNGGLGEQSAPACTSGQLGAHGADGAFGLGGSGDGRLTADGFVGYSGQDGQPGAPGQGGGGGGATFGKAAVCGAASPGGAAGGSGGTGGCGGKGGGGGQGGGASIAIATRGQKNHGVCKNTDLKVGKGGKGGDGGYPTSGGIGGGPSAGGNGAGSIKPGCWGGAGGNGGKGGWGGGGAGGLASCRVFTGVVGWEGDCHCQQGEGGTGGKGVPFSGDGRGQDGTHADLIILDL